MTPESAFTVTHISEEKGRGLIATLPIGAGAVIDVAPVLVIPRGQMKGSALQHYVYWWDDGHQAVAFGPVSMVNHSDQPNATLARDRQAGLLRMVALRDIEPGEEIAHRYRQSYWFEAR